MDNTKEKFAALYSKLDPKEKKALDHYVFSGQADKVRELLPLLVKKYV